MSVYLQTSTANPYGHRPWATRLYTTFDDFAYLKQPQNTIIRENPTVRPTIYKPPEMAGLGAVIVSGSGRVIGRARRRPRGLGNVIYDPMFESGRGGIYSTPIIVRPISSGPIMPGPMPTPPTILPPSIVPPPPRIVASGPGGTVYALPGIPATPGSPYMPTAPGELPSPGSPVSQADGSAAAATPPSSFSDWFNSSTWIAGIPNGYVALAAAGAVYFISKKGRR